MLSTALSEDTHCRNDVGFYKSKNLENKHPSKTMMTKYNPLIKESSLVLKYKSFYIHEGSVYQTFSLNLFINFIPDFSLSNVFNHFRCKD